MLPVVMKVVMVVAAGLFGTWQVAYLPAVTTYLTLPSYKQVQSYLTSVGRGKTTPSFGMSETENVIPSFGYDDSFPASMVVADQLSTTNNVNQSLTPVEAPKPSAAHVSFIQYAPTWINIGPEMDEEATSFGEVLIDKLDSFDTVLDHLFSFVKECPTSAPGTLTFSLAAILITSFVFVIATVSYWALPLFSIRGQNATKAKAFLPQATEIIVPTLENIDYNALSIISNILQLHPANTSFAHDKHSMVQADPMEILAFATDIVQVHSDAVKNDLHAEVKKFVNTFEIERITKQRKELEREFRAQLDIVTNGNNYSILQMKEDLQTELGDLKSEVYVYLDSIRQVSEDCQSAEKASKAAVEQSTVTGLALETVKASLPGREDTVTTLLHDFDQLKSRFENVQKASLDERQENKSQLQKFKERTDENVIKLLNRFKELKTGLKNDQKVSHDEHLENQSLIQRFEDKTEENVTKLLNAFKELETKVKNVQKESANERQGNNSMIQKLEREKEEDTARLFNSFKELEVQFQDVQKVSVNERQENKLLVQKLEEKEEHVTSLIKDFKQLESKFNSLEAGLFDERQEKLDFFKRLAEKEQEHKAEVFKLSTQADERVSKVVNDFKQLQENLLKKDAMAAQTDSQMLANTSHHTSQSTPEVIHSPTAPESPKIAQTLPYDRKLVLNDQRSNLYTPKVKFDPVAAQKGSDEMMSSRHALSGPRLANMTQKPRTSAGARSSRNDLGSSPWARGPKPAPAEIRFTLEQKVLQDPSLTNEQRMQFATCPNSEQSLAIKKAYEDHVAAAEASLPQNQVDTNAESSDAAVDTASPAPEEVTTSPAADTTSPLPDTAADPDISAPNTINAAPPQTPTSDEPSGAAPPAWNPPTGPKIPTIKQPFPVIPPGHGPGPQGGKRRQTDRTKTHDVKSRGKNAINKFFNQALTEGQRRHALSRRDPATLLFAEGSEWEWLNPVMSQNLKPGNLVPYGWVAPSL